MSLEQPAQPQDDPPRDPSGAPGPAAGAGGERTESRHVWTDAFREFDALYESSTEQRAARLAELRASAPAVASALEGLLAEHDKQAVADDPQATVRRDGRWLMTLPPGGTPSAAAPAAMPETIGPWRLLRELGQGGTARVFLARREDVPWMREVALKVPLMGVLREDLRERLVRERDILSRLEHPHIARLYDAGFAESQPWLAIEYVQGHTILSACDARTATLRERVALFRQVLQAVQYAHAALIVHRDLKPENILVTPDGSVRLLDFGIAKLLAEGASHTETTQLTHIAGRMLTPAYASPEQLRDEPLTTATDIYSLGVVLYELLTGVHPCAQGTRSLQQMERAITEGRLSLASRSPIRAEGAKARGLPVKVLRRELAGDLEAMLAKAMDLDPARRYETAAAFDADLEAWLDGRPVRARRPTALQFAGKLVRRHPWVSAFATTSVLALSLTTVTAVLQAREARVQAEQARIEAARARSSKDFLLGLFDEADPDRNGGRDVLARDLLTRGEQRVERDLANQPQLMAEMLAAIGKVWWQFGDMDNAARVLQKRSEVAAVVTPGSGHVDALLDEIQGAREAGDYVRAEQILSRVDQITAKETEPSLRQAARIGFERAWITVRVHNNAESALALLDKAEFSASSAGERVLESDILVARGWILRTQDLYAKADVALDRAERILVEERQHATAVVSPTQIHAVKLERLRTMARAGAYRRGWPLIDRLVAEVASATGENRYYHLQFRAWWFAWAVQLGLLEPARDWLVANPSEYAQMDMRELAVSAERYRWMARLWSGLGEWSKVDQVIALGLSEPGIAGSLGELNLHIAYVEALLMQGRSELAIERLGVVEPRLGVLAKDVNSVSELRMLQSVALAQLRRYPEAVASAGTAVAMLRDLHGADHARTAAAELNLLLIEWRQSPRPSIDSGFRDRLTHAIKVLQESYLESSRPLGLARRLERATLSVDDRSRIGSSKSEVGLLYGPRVPPL